MYSLKDLKTFISVNKTKITRYLKWKTTRKRDAKPFM